MVGLHNKRGLDSEEGLGSKAMGIFLFVLVAALVGGGFWYLHVQRQEKQAFDPNTFCPKDGAKSVTAVLIDRTDSLNELQIATLRSHIIRWAKDIPKHGKFVVYEVGLAGKLIDPVLSQCSPGDGSDASILNSNPAQLRASYQRKYLKPIDAMLASMRADQEASASPIMEAIQAIALKEFGEDNGNPDASLVIVSDLLQHDQTFSLYKSPPQADAFAKSATGRSLHSDLSNVTTSVYLIDRVKDAKFQTNSLGDFWVKWLTYQGAIVDSFHHLPG